MGSTERNIIRAIRAFRENKTDVDLHHEAGRDYAMYEDDYGYHSSYNYSSYYDYDYDIQTVSASKFQGLKRLT